MPVFRGSGCGIRWVSGSGSRQNCPIKMKKFHVLKSKMFYLEGWRLPLELGNP